MEIRQEQAVVHSYTWESMAETDLLLNRFFESRPEPVHRCLHSLAQSGIQSSAPMQDCTAQFFPPFPEARLKICSRELSHARFEHPECLVTIDRVEGLQILVTMWAWPDNRSGPAAVFEGEPSEYETLENRNGAVGIA
jgi:hypothetical protein